MSYLSQFDHDLFISYAHLDNATPGDDQEGWVTYFEKSIVFRVGQLYGRKPRVWRDPTLTGHTIFSDEITDRLSKVALLVTILSPRYVQSDWCLKEVEAFSQAAKQSLGIHIKNKARIFKVVKTPIDVARHPGVLREMLGYEFYERDSERGIDIEFDQLTNADTKKDFWRVLNVLARDITDFMEMLAHEETEPSPQGVSPEASAKKHIYVAETGHDLKEARANIKRELESHDYLILPDRQLSLVVPDYQQEVEQMLARAELSIHMVGEKPGIVPDGAERPIIELQNQLAARKSSASGFKRLIWLPRGVHTENEQHQLFIESLRDDQEKLAGAELLHTSLKEFKQEMMLRLTPEPEPPPNGVAHELLYIYLIYDKTDEVAVGPLDDYLYNQGYEVIRPDFEGNVIEVREKREDTLRMCDAVLVYYGEAPASWPGPKLMELSKIAGLGRTRGFLAKCLFIAGPTTPEKERFRTRGALVIKHFDDFTEQALAPFVAAIEEKRKSP